MIKNLILTFMLGGSLLFSCSSPSDDNTGEETTEVKEKAIELANLDTSVLPQKDFYDYATGGWRKNNPLTDEYSSYGSFDVLAEQNVEQVKGIIEEAAKDFGEAGSVKEKILPHFMPHLM